MRFDILFAAISSGLYAPLGLMAGGFVLAVGGLIFLLWRRKKGAEPAHTVEDTTPETQTNASTAAYTVADEAAPIHDASSEAASAPVSAPGGRRRRSLVGGAERENGTPTGEDFAQDDAPPAEEIETETFEASDIEDAELGTYEEDEHGAADDGLLEELDNLPEEASVAPADLEELDPNDTDIDLEAEWIEPAAEDAPNAGLPAETDEVEEAADIDETAQTVAIAGTAGAAAALATGALSTNAHSDENDELDPEIETHAEVENADEEPEGHEAPTLDPEPAATQAEVAEIIAARKRPIVMRQFMPQRPGEDGLSFFGGQPIGPSDFQWPRERGAEGGNPLQFIMQWDCSQLSLQDPTGLLPQDGVLYCFINNDHTGEEEFLSSHTFIHHKGAVGTWGLVPVPEDAGPALGRVGAFALSGSTPFIEKAESYVARLLPRFPFDPVAFDYPASNENEAEAWSDTFAARALLEVQNSGVAVRPSADDAPNGQHELGRPFASFPHDFGAIRVLASRMMETLNAPDEFLAETLYPNLTPDEREAQFANWADEAQEIYLLGTQREQGQKLDQAIADDIWQWFESRRGILGETVPALYEESVDLSLGVGSEALGNVPAEWIDKAMQSHALAREWELTEADDAGQIHTNTPVRMFGPPSLVSDAAEAMAHEHILLLELPNGSGPQHHFNAQALQYWIAPHDLAAGKFDQVKAIIAKA